jgi:hypothetical protein
LYIKSSGRYDPAYIFYSIVLFFRRNKLKDDIKTNRQYFFRDVYGKSALSTFKYIVGVLKLKLCGFGPRASYTDRATAASWRS